MTILEALDDPALFGSAFNGPTWRAWRAFLAARCSASRFSKAPSFAFWRTDDAARDFLTE